MTEPHWMPPAFSPPRAARQQQHRTKRRNQPPGLVDHLRAQRGRWAEVARYPWENRKPAHARGSHLRRRHPDITYVVAADGITDEAVLYMSALPKEEAP